MAEIFLNRPNVRQVDEPETISTAKIGQARIYAHVSAGCDY